MLLVASETGHVYTFATRKLQPMITSENGKALIQTCLNSPDSPASELDTTVSVPSAAAVGPVAINNSTETSDFCPVKSTAGSHMVSIPQPLSLPDHGEKLPAHQVMTAQNCLARIVLQDNYSSATSLLSELHWVPVSKRINFKIATLAYQSLAFGQPTYLLSLLTPHQPEWSLS